MILNALKLESVAKPDDNGLVRIEGYACHYGTANKNGWIVDEKSFADFFNELAEGGMMPVFNYMHTDRIIGGWDSFTSDEIGLKAVGHLNCNCADVRDNILPLMQSGDVCHLSTEGYSDYDREEEREDGIYCGGIKLTGVSLVALPADFDAKATIINSYRERHKADKKAEYKKPIF